MGKYDDLVEEVLSGPVSAHSSPEQSPAPVQPQVGGDMESIISGAPVSRGEVPTGSISTITTQPITKVDPTFPDPPGFETIYKASLVNDPETKKKIFSEARGIPLDRYGIRNGEIVFVDDSGVLRSEESNLPGSGVKRFLASATSPPVIGGVVGSVGGIPGAVAGAMGGEAVRQAVAGVALGDPQTVYENLFRMGSEGLLAFMGELSGKGIFKLANQVLGIGKGEARKVAGSMTTNISKDVMDEAVRVKEIADHWGIDLNVADAVGSQELVAKLNFLRDLPQSAEVIKAADTLKREQIQRAIPKFLQEMAGGDLGTPVRVGRDTVEMVGDITQGLSKRRSAMTAPLYERAWQSADGVPVEADIQPVVNFIDNELKTAKGDIRDALLALKKDLLVPDLPGKKSVYGIADDMTGAGGGSTKPGGPQLPGGDRPQLPAPKSNLPSGDGSGGETNITFYRGTGGGAPSSPRGFGGSGGSGGSGTPPPGSPPGSTPPPSGNTIDATLESTGPHYETSLKGLHGIKVLIDRKLSRPQRDSMDALIGRELKIARQILLEQMEEASPQYRIARNVHRLLSRGNVTNTGRALQTAEGLSSVISKLPEKDVVNAGSYILSHKNTRPEIVAELRDQFMKEEGGEVLWNKMVANYMEMVFDNLPETAERNLGDSFRKAIEGRTKQSKILKEALTPQQLSTMNDFFTVLRRTGLTAPKTDVGIARTEAQKGIRRQYESELLTTMTSPLRTPKRLLADRVNDIRFGRGSAELARLLLSDTAFEQLKTLKRMPPGSDKLVEGLGVFLGLQLGEETRFRLSKAMTMDQNPPSIRNR